MRLHSRCRLGLYHLKAWPFTSKVADSHMAGNLVWLLVGSLTFSPLGCVTTITTWWLACPGVNKSRNQGKCDKVLGLLSKVTDHYFCNFLLINSYWSHWDQCRSLIHSWKRIHKGATTKRQGLPGATLELSYHRSPSIHPTHMHWAHTEELGTKHRRKQTKVPAFMIHTFYKRPERQQV